MYDAIRRAIMGPQSEPLSLAPAPTNVVDLRTRKPHYPPNSLARALANIDEAFASSRRIPTDG
jgi:hypothetical protein